MSKLFRSVCCEKRLQKTSTTSYQHQENAKFQGTNQTKEEYLSKYIGQYEHKCNKFLAVAMMVCRPSFHSVTKYSAAYVVLGFLLSLTMDLIYSTQQTTKYATPVTFVSKCQLTRELMDVEQERQKSYYYGSLVWAEQ